MERYIIEYYLRCSKDAKDKEDAERILAYMKIDADYKDIKVIHLVEEVDSN